MPGVDLRATRAYRVFCTDGKHIGTENTVMVKKQAKSGFSYKIANYLRMAFHP